MGRARRLILQRARLCLAACWDAQILSTRRRDCDVVFFQQATFLFCHLPEELYYKKSFVGSNRHEQRVFSIIDSE